MLKTCTETGNKSRPEMFSNYLVYRKGQRIMSIFVNCVMSCAHDWLVHTYSYVIRENVLLIAIHKIVHY